MIDRHTNARRAPWWLAALFGLGACYETQPLRVQVGPATANATCVATVEKVMAEAGFGPRRDVVGPERFYSRRGVLEGRSLRWGVGVWMTPATDARICDVQLEAVTGLAEPCTDAQCTMTGQRRDELDRTVQDLRARLDLALRVEPQSDSPAPDGDTNEPDR